jgi:hypothetical protein
MLRPLLAMALALVCAFAQTPDTAAIHGHVADQSHAAISGVRIEVRGAGSGAYRSAETDAAGDFSIAALPVAGAYSVTASKQGFAEKQVTGLQLVAGATASLEIELSVAAGSATVTVTGVAGEVRSDAPQVGDRLDAAQIDAIPALNNRLTFLPMVNAANRPAISQGDVFMNQFLFTTNGSGRRQTTFVVDGGTANDSWGRQTIFSSLPMAAVAEMTVLSSAFSAEYGANAGAVVNIVTKGGGSSLHGDLAETWRPEATAAALSGFTTTNATSGNQITSDTLGQSDADISGPLGKATWFSAAGEFSREDRASPVISPVAPGSFVGHYRAWLGYLRLDRRINDRHSLFFRSDVDGFHDTNPNGIVGGNTLPSVARVFLKRTYTEELGETAVLSPSLVNSFRAQFMLASPITQFDPVIDGTQFQVPVSTGGTFTTGTSQSALLLNHQYEATDTLALVRGRHQVKVGASAVHAHTGGNSKEFGGPIYLGQFVYKTCTQALTICEGQTYLGNIANVATYTQSYGDADYEVGDTLWSVFAQDDFHARPDLTFNLGLRYERQTFTDFRRGFAPRAGFAYNWRGDGKTVIRGGFGIYYSQIVDNSEANYALTGPTGVFNYTAAPGQIGFPSSISAAPLPAFPAGAQVPLRTLYIRPGDASYYNQFLPVSTLTGYQLALLNPYSEEWNLGIQRRLPGAWVLSLDYVGEHTLRVNRPLDLDPPAPFIRTAPGQTRSAQAANCTRPYWIWWYQQNSMTCNPSAATNPQPPYSVVTSDVNDGYAFYDALDANLAHSFNSRLSMLVSYTWSHAIDNVDPDVPSQNPNDPNFTGKTENGNAIFDQRQRLVLTGLYSLPGKVRFGGIATLASGLPFNFTTGTTNSGDSGATTDRPVIGGVVVGRNTGRGNAIYEFSPFLDRPFSLFAGRVQAAPRVEAFNVFNHANFVGYSGTYGNGALPGAGFGAPLTGITSQLPARSLQFSLKLAF